ncbi:MAG: four helix bundle protein [Patescibacteria group bacterium]
MVPLVHKIRNLYKTIYRLGSTLPKRDKLGIHSSLEATCLVMLTLAIEASFTRGFAKKPTLEKLRLKAEIGKQLVRTEQELGIITDAVYLEFGSELVEISKMTTRWIQSLH